MYEATETPPPGPADRLPDRLHRLPGRLPALSSGRFLDGAVVVAAVAPALIDQFTTDTSATAWLALSGYAVVASVALLVRTRRPLSGFAAVLAVLVVLEVGCAAAEVKISSLAVLPLAFGLYAMGTHAPPRRSLLLLGGAAAFVLLGVGVNHATASERWRGGTDVFAVLAPLPAAWGLGLATRGRQELLAGAERRAADARRDQAVRAERAAAAERARIARDMHDVVAHSLTLLVVHAETMRARSGELPPWAREGVDAMAAAGRRATGEMRELLGVLRNETGEAAPRSPVPQLADLEVLVADAERAGTPVRLDVAAGSAELPRPVQLTGYRLVQECLANARRHAPGAEVGILIRTGPGATRFEVGCAPPPAGHRAAAGAGVGLVGVRERIAALGGGFTAGPTPGGGFRVVASVPVTAGGGTGAHHR
ncbi:sensor histidine kinase [Streptomyces sp. NPDC059142]|uniref:sensor histidine kinase n=1 Tax=Streptomyces sp. NPDC059142 TaxID=3346739 RepID=UPI00368AA6AD